MMNYTHQRNATIGAAKYRPSQRERYSTLHDGGNQAAEELWRFSTTKVDPGSMGVDAPTSLAGLVAIGQNKNLESVPHNTFKNGIAPRTTHVASEAQSDYQEADTQPISAIYGSEELLALSNMAYMLPGAFSKHVEHHHGEVVGGLEMMRGARVRRYKTSYEKKKGRSVKMQSTSRTRRAMMGKANTSLEGNMTQTAMGTAQAPKAPLTMMGGARQVVGQLTNAQMASLARVVHQTKVWISSGFKFAQLPYPAGADMVSIVTASVFNGANIEYLIKAFPTSPANSYLESLKGMLGQKVLGSTYTVEDLFQVAHAMITFASLVPFKAFLALIGL